MIYTGDIRAWGLIPRMLNPNDKRGAAEQLNANYQHGGGYHHQDGFTVYFEDGLYLAEYDGDPPWIEVGRVELGDETVVLFPHSYVAVVQNSGEFVIARMD